MNKDLPRDEQLRIVLKNYDKKQAECEALKKENEDLKKRLQQKDIVYKNMLDRFKTNSPNNFETQYKELLDAHKALQDDNAVLRRDKENLEAENKILCKENKKIMKGLKGIKGIIRGAGYQIDRMRGLYDDDFVKEDEDEHEYVQPANKVTANAPTYQEWQLLQFCKYIRDLVSNFNKTGSLRGIATLAKEYGVRSLTKEQFFQFGLHNTPNVSDEYLTSIFTQAKKR